MNSLRYLFVLFSICILNTAHGQVELGPLTQNHFQNSTSHPKNGTIDSSFIYSTDTIGLPFFDDFTSNKIQQYTPDFQVLWQQVICIIT